MFIIDTDSLIQLAKVFGKHISKEREGSIKIKTIDDTKKSIIIGYKFNNTYKTYDSAFFEFIFWSESGDIDEIIGKNNNFAFNLKFVLNFKLNDDIPEITFRSYKLEEAIEINGDEKSKNTWSKRSLTHNNNVINTKKKLSCLSNYQERKYRIPDYIQFFNYYKMGEIYNDMLKQITYPKYEYDKKLTFMRVQPNSNVIKYITTISTSGHNKSTLIECNYYDKIGTADVTINLKRTIVKKDYFEAIADITILVVNTVNELINELNFKELYS
jgi:hypothetical protein